jgi:exodeoxyribonuclease VII small subunit
MTAKKDESFEDLYGRLESTVEKLEKGGLPLEDSIALYEEGMGLAKRCQEILDKAELRITKLRESFAQPAAEVADEAPVLDGDSLPFDDE